MSATFEKLRILQQAEEIADGIWEQVAGWDAFAKDVVGGQLARATDSIGANIAESFGRFHYGEKLQFLYYARGSLFETKYWLNRVLTRNLMSHDECQTYSIRLTDLVRQLNAFTKGLKAQRHKHPSVGETTVDYIISSDPHFTPSDKSFKDFVDSSDPLFDDREIEWLRTVTQQPKP